MLCVQKGAYVNIYFSCRPKQKNSLENICNNVQFVLKKLCSVTNSLFWFLTWKMGSHSPLESNICPRQLGEGKYRSQAGNVSLLGEGKYRSRAGNVIPCSPSRINN